MSDIESNELLEPFERLLGDVSPDFVRTAVSFVS